MPFLALMMSHMAMSQISKERFDCSMTLPVLTVNLRPGWRLPHCQRPALPSLMNVLTGAPQTGHLTPSGHRIPSR